MYEFREAVATLREEGRFAWTSLLPTVGSRVTASPPFSFKLRWPYQTQIQSQLGWLKTGARESPLVPFVRMANVGTLSRPYSMSEAVEGFRRAANTHGWRVPKELDRLVR